MNKIVANNLGTLVALYNSPGRAYHNMTHINSLLAHLEEARKCTEFLALSIEEWDALETAIWFHDAIYNARAQQITPGYSESESARLLTCLCQDTRMEESNHFWVALKCIKVTAQHAEVGLELTQVEQLMLDIDLADLGIDFENFLINTENVCLEYTDNSNNNQREVEIGNAKFLNRLLQKPRIYHTEFFHDKYEEYARRNLKNRISWMEQRYGTNIRSTK